MLKIQLGKNGVTQGFVESLIKIFKKRDLVKISVFKSLTRDKKAIKDIAIQLKEELKKSTKKDYAIRVVGFTIVLRKLRIKNKKQI